jgi:hypothetical protein
VQDLLFFETVDKQRVGNTPPVYGTPHPDTDKFPNHVLAHVKQADPQGQLYEYYYANTRTSQDEYNFEYSQASLGQTKFNTVVRTYVSLRSEFTEDDSAVVAGTDMPTAPTAANFTGKGYILMGRDQKRIGDRELDGVFVVEQRTYFVREDIETLKWDDLSNRNLKSTLSYYYTGETPTGEEATIDALVVDSDNAWWQTAVTAADGISVAAYREGRQASADWFEVVKQEVIAGTTGGEGLIDVIDYKTSMNYSWPPVLDFIEIVAWEKHDGQLLTFPEYHMEPEAYSGPCQATVTIQWSKTKFSSVAAKAMLPQSFQFGTPYVRLQVPPCLMNGGKLVCSTGTVDPVYKYQVYIKNVPVTKPAKRPASIVARDEQQPARGGYLRTKWTVHAPAY